MEPSTSTSYQQGNRLDLFFGDRNKLKAFSRKLALWFGQNPNNYRFDNEKISFAASYLRGAAFEWLKPFVNESVGKVQFDTFADLMNALKASFSDPDTYVTSERKMESLKQYTSCSAYFSKFLALIAQLGWHKDAVKIHHFRCGLKDKIKDMLVGRDVPSAINKFATIWIKLYNQDQTRAQEKNVGLSSLHINSSKPTNSCLSPPSSQSAPLNFDLNQSRGEPMELDAASRKAYRKANNFCTYCGVSGHFVHNCPKIKARDTKLALASVQPLKPPDKNLSALYEIRNKRNRKYAAIYL